MVKLKKTFQTNLSRVRERVDEYKERKDSLSERGQGSELPWYEWKEQNTIRLMPAWSQEMAEEGVLAKVIISHFSLPPDKKGYKCLRKTWGRQCYICTAFSRIWQQDKQYDFKWRMRAWANCIDRENEDKGVQIIGFPISVYRWIEQIMTDKEVKDIADIENGSDLRIKKEKIGPAARDVKYPCTLWERGVPLHKNVEVMNEWIGQIHDLDKIFKAPTRKQFQENLKAANAFLRDQRLPEIDPDNLRDTDMYVIEDTFPRDADNVRNNDDRGEESRRREEEVIRQSAEDGEGKPTCFGSFDKDADDCLVCAIGSDCSQALADGEGWD